VDAPSTSIDAALVDFDGSCRDMNFDRATWTGLRSLIDQVRREFTDVQVGSTSHDSDEVQVADMNVALDVRRLERPTAVSATLADGSLVRRRPDGELQCPQCHGMGWLRSVPNSSA